MSAIEESVELSGPVVGPAKWLVPERMSPALIKAEYAVRGAIVKRALAIKAELAREKGSDTAETKSKKFKFDKVIMCNIGNPQALGQIPITFVRQVVAACVYPDLIKADGLLPEDVCKRAERILADTASLSVGAYTHSQG